VWLSLLNLSLLTTPVWATGQSADDYFHKGAQYYVFGEKEKAGVAIHTGLQTYPQDPKLNAVARLLLRKDPEDQNKSKNSQQKQQKQDKDQDQKKQQQQDQKSAQQKKDEEKARQEQAKKDQEKKEQQAQADPAEKKDKPDENAEQAADAQLHMSPQEARQLLEAAKDDAKMLLFSPENQPVKTQPGKIKDW
jgi:superfamily II DNA/RNA helicase